MVKILTESIYPVTIHIVWDQTHEETEAYMKKIWEDDDLMLDPSPACEVASVLSHPDSASGHVILKLEEENLHTHVEGITLLAHECSHLVDYTMDFIGEEISVSRGDEVRAYLLQYYLKNVLDLLGSDRH